jgi:hypothetical protein
MTLHTVVDILRIITIVAILVVIAKWAWEGRL